MNNSQLNGPVLRALCAHVVQFTGCIVIIVELCDCMSLYSRAHLRNGLQLEGYSGSEVTVRVMNTYSIIIMNRLQIITNRSTNGPHVMSHNMRVVDQLI